MKHKKIFMLPIVLGTFLAGCTLVRTFLPIVIVPKLDIPNIVLVSLIALLFKFNRTADMGKDYIAALILSSLTFGLLPFAAGFAAGVDALKLAVAGAAGYTITAWLFGLLSQCISIGPVTKATRILCALGLYLAAQGFYGIFL